MGNTADASGKLVIDVPRGKHGPLTVPKLGLVEPPQQSPLAVGEPLPLNPLLAICPFPPYDRFHSKTLHASGVMKFGYSIKPRKMRGFRVFFKKLPGQRFRVRLIKG
jgi:hypothetical protein